MHTNHPVNYYNRSETLNIYSIHGGGDGPKPRGCNARVTARDRRCRTRRIPLCTLPEPGYTDGTPFILVWAFYTIVLYEQRRNRKRENGEKKKIVI